MKYEIYEGQGFVLVELTGKYKCFRAQGDTKEEALGFLLEHVNKQLEVYTEAIEDIQEGLKQIEIWTLQE